MVRMNDYNKAFSEAYRYWYDTISEDSGVFQEFLTELGFSDGAEHLFTAIRLKDDTAGGVLFELWADFKATEARKYAEENWARTLESDWRGE